MSDFWGDVFPNWVIAGTSMGTLGAAIVAGYFAARAAHWTGAQAESSQKMVEIAKEDAERSRQQIEFQVREAEYARQTQTRARLDQLAPVIIARARPGFDGDEGCALFWRKMYEHAQPDNFVAVTEDFIVEGSELVGFQERATIEIENISAIPALIDFVDAWQYGQFDIPQGNTLTLKPGEKRSVRWWNVFSATDAREQEGSEVSTLLSLFRPKFWVRDLGMNVRDTYAFSAGFQYFTEDGSRLHVSALPAFPWNETTAQPCEDRRYERLEAGTPPQPDQPSGPTS